MPDVKPAAAATTGAKAVAGDSASPAAAPAQTPAAAPAPTPAATNGNGTPQKLPPVPAAAFDMPKPNLRGLNKPKCIQCGNVARSRCPFQCCKACCYKAQNPCHIHVLKQTNTLPDKPSPTTAPVTEQASTNLPATGSSSRLACLQKLPHHFLNSLRTKKSLGKKDVASINKWMFMKLKEHMQGDVDAENEAYERYTQNVGLLEETFCPMEDAAAEPEPEATSSEEERMDLLVSEAKVRLKSDNENADSFKERIATILAQKLKKLHESQSTYEDDKPADQSQDDHTTPVKLSTKQKMEKAAKFNELLGKMMRARSEDDLKPCRDLIEQLFGKEDGSSMDKSNRMETEPSNQESAAATAQPYSFPKLCTRIEVDEDFAAKVDAEFSSLSEVVQL
ncbi:hypothetical protein SEVIR_9G356200v4 [Setaria viridis]|uniref:Uncharacterized protein n=2 Tax=Setaria TaxID=4554 RepID=K4AAZ9_SETIT|nr:uncharacterized protein LOC101775802 [Setaria italica]XP_034576801.1 uncharacterized protein LOC117840407 [Setaria viridis]RCV44138.1 hypothetical protein SETIT_9G350100v2 [Setaria italica]TKV95325.1 hypothetical protein SEVIR_9G356200v2 [Setaria viridis]TKV95326.1 hypothetical protein SEVIR_9G356200v2 [Setaria viridis]